MMRIITGTARGTRLDAPEGIHTRPTSERAKQGVFNILQFEIRGRRVLDLFAGSGQMGLEALSRGAASAVFADADPQAVKVLKSNIKKTHVEEKSTVFEGDYKTVLRTLSSQTPFDLIFLDPPYHSDMLSSALTLLRKYHLIAPHAYLICETDGTLPVFGEDLVLFKSAAYGKNHMYILKFKEETT